MKTVRMLFLVILLTGTLFMVDWVIARSAVSEEGKTYFFDRLGDLMLVGREDQLYIQRIDGSNRRKITSTLDVIKLDAFFGYGGRYVMYKTVKKKSGFDKKRNYEHKYYMQLIDDNDLKKKEIDVFIYRDFKKKRIRERKKTE